MANYFLWLYMLQNTLVTEIVCCTRRQKCVCVQPSSHVMLCQVTEEVDTISLGKDVR